MNIDEVNKALAEVGEQIVALECKRAQIRRQCTHKNPDGSDASEGVPVSGERFCRTCFAQYD